MTTQSDAAGGRAPLATPVHGGNGGHGGHGAAALPNPPGYDVAINAESRTYHDGDEIVSILSVHTLVCPLIRAELRGESAVRVLAYYPAGTRLGLHAYEMALRDDPAVQERLGLRRFVRDVLTLPETPAHLHHPAVREMYLHEVIRRRADAIAACRLATDDEFAVAQII